MNKPLMLLTNLSLTNFILPRCPHCAIAKPNLRRVGNPLRTRGSNLHDMERVWCIYVCSACGGVVTAWSYHGSDMPVSEYFPESEQISIDIPEKPRGFLQQALECLHVPAGLVMLSASAVDAMLKAKGYSDGSLYKRIEKAAIDHAITKEMAEWAHDVRLDANDQRHADEDADMPTREDAVRIFEFARALAEFMFVLPSRVQRGLASRQPQPA